jgi:hypothetical protein
MAPRRDNTAEVDTPATETDTVTSPEQGAASATPAKQKRGTLPDGYVTPVGLATEISKRGLHKNKDGQVVELKPQMVYSYKKNAPKDHPFPIEQVQDSNGETREALKLEAGLAWWTERAELAAKRRESAAAKKAEKEAKAAERAANATTAEAETPVTEAE